MIIMQYIFPGIIIYQKFYEILTVLYLLLIKCDVDVFINM